MKRRDVLHLPVATLAAGCFGLTAAMAGAQPADPNFPTRPIRVLVGFTAGGSTDTPMRVLAANAAKILGQPVVIENKPGAAGVIPAQLLQSSGADGYTIAVIPQGVYRAPYTSNISWDPAQLGYIIGLSGYVFGIAVPADSPIRTIADYVAYARAHPGELSYSTPGSLTTNHLTMEQFARLTQTRLNHVPFKGTPESLQAVMAGHVMSAAETSGWVPYVEAGKLRLLAVWSDKRMPRFAAVPTLKESGINLVQTSPWGLAAPPHTPPAVVARLHDAFKRAMEQPNFREVLSKYDMEPAYLSSEAYRRYAIAAMAREHEVLKQIGFTRSGAN